MTVEAKALSPVSDDRLLGTVFDRDNDALNILFFITEGLLVFNISEVSSSTISLSLLLRVVWDLWNFSSATGNMWNRSWRSSVDIINKSLTRATFAW